MKRRDVSILALGGAMPNDYTFPSGVDRLSRATGKALNPSLETRKSLPARPIGVAVISVIYFLAGGALLVFALSRVWRLQSYDAVPPEEVGTRNGIFVEGVGGLCLLPLVALLVLTAFGLWTLRTWGLFSSFRTSTLAFLWTVLVAVFATLQGTYEVLISILPGAIILLYLAQPKVRAQFR